MSGIIPRAWIKLSKVSMKRLASSKGFGIFCIFAIWTTFALLAGIANYLDLQAEGYRAMFSRQLLLFSMLFLPIPFLSSALYLFCEKYKDRAFQLRNLLLLLGFLLFLFLPLFTTYETTYLYVQAKKSWPDSSKYLSQISISQVIVDGVIVLFSASIQIAFAYWRRTLRQFSLSKKTDEEILRLRLKRLQGQLEPGFLLHSLNQVANFVLVAEQKKATRAVVLLSELLRYVLDSQHRAYLSIADEIEFLNDYLELRNLHFNDHLRIDWNLNNVDWREYQSPALLLHPIVEFAIGAIQEKVEKENTSILIVICASHQTIRVGVFFSPDTYVGQLSTETLKMAKERLKVLYGDAATLQNAQSNVLSDLATTHIDRVYSQGIVMEIPSQRI